MAHTMEGFLDKKGSGKQLLGRTNWNKRWFVLDGVSRIRAVLLVVDD